MQIENRIYVDEPCVVSFFIGELGWFLQRWQSYLRFLKTNVHKDHKFIIMMNMQFHPFVNDFVAYTLDLPKEFYELGLETDCYEAPVPGSPPGSLTPPEVYSSLIRYIRNFYNTEKAIELWTPRGVNTWVDHQPHMFVKYASNAPEPVYPIITIFPRCRSRASNRNVPEYIWEGIVNELKKSFYIVLAGTPSGSALADYTDERVINLIRYNDSDKIERIMHYLTHSTMSISSQSGPTHISLLCNTPTFIIGHERIRHSVIENRFKAPVSFRYVQDYRCVDVSTLLQDADNFLNILLNASIITPYMQRIELVRLRPALENLSGRRNLVGAEIGVYAGKNAYTILRNLDIKKLYLIDPYKTYEGLETVQGTNTNEDFAGARGVAHTKLAEFSDRIVWLEDLSENVIGQIKEQLDFVYIDGNHEYEWVKKDLENYFPLVKDGGIIGGHDYDAKDYTNPGPGSTVYAVNEFFGKIGISNVPNAVCFDDPRSRDWWYGKPSNDDSILQKDVETLLTIINEEHS